ncbi:hypothetical protein SLEP1_g10526 [Rubroshorea leprosula]|uniref:NB-ARC domain-containing protein n=1 Tax=Rubroshorea leprosula TaxID=152421 RepID=A0AAV5IEA3_9ROSI|nr:hypothetical protein SLEP1_g10526 [Rubroshorea leprosula]
MSMLASFLEDALAVKVKTDGIDIGGNIIKPEDGSTQVHLYLSVFSQEAKAYLIADAVVSFLLERLGNLLIDETTLLWSVRDQVQQMQTELKRIQKEGEGTSLAFERQRQLRWSYSHVVEEYIVGFDEDIRQLIAQLVNEEKYRVVSICGMGGLGKTTMAKAVYHHGDIRRHFEGFAWAYVSQQCKRRDIWEGIVLKLIIPSREEREEILRMRDEDLAKKLFKVQKEKKCLIVIDDIWSTEAWSTLSAAFPNETASGSKVLLTTRNKESALIADQEGFVHEPDCLNEEKSWELFQRKAFPRRGDSDFGINKDKEKVGRGMVGSCAGLPLAIVVLGGLLATKETLSEWDMVNRNIRSYLSRTKGHEQARLSEVLALSYHELPYQLKPCFLYLSQFPEDFDIPTKKLVQQWVAEGFVFPQDEIEGDETVEDVAEGYLHSLINRCMVQVGVRGSIGKIKTCHLLDLMRDLCLLKARQESFMDIIDHWFGNETLGAFSSSNETRSIRRSRRLSILLREDVDDLTLPQYKKKSQPEVPLLLPFKKTKIRYRKDNEFCCCQVQIA